MELYQQLKNKPFPNELNSVQIARTINLIENKDVLENITALIVYHYMTVTNNTNVNLSDLYGINCQNNKGPHFNFDKLPDQLKAIIANYLLVCAID